MNIKPVVAALVAAALTFNSFPADSFAAAFSARTPSGTAAGALELPSALGRVTAACLSGADPRIIVVQDLHCNAGVQKNIAGILSFLDRKYRINRVYLEGNSGAVDTSWVNAVTDPAERKKAVQTLLAAGRLTGPEYFSIQSGRHDIVRGPEDETLYRENIVRLSELIGHRGEIAGGLDRVRRKLDKLCADYYGPRNRKLNDLLSRRANGNIDDRKLYRALFKLARSSGIPVDDYVNIAGFVGLKRNSRWSPARVNADLHRLMLVLKTRLSYADYRLLTDDYNAGMPDRWAVALKTIASRERLSLRAEYPSLWRYLEMRSTDRALNPVALVAEERHMVRALRDALSDSRAEREIAFLADAYACLEEFFTQKISPDAYAVFTASLPAFKDLCIKYEISLTGLYPWFKTAGKFYEANLARNSVFLRNMSELTGSGPGTIVLVAGGFHTAGVTERLRESGTPYVAVMPAVSDISNSSESMYEKLIIEQARRYAGQTINGEAVSNNLAGLPAGRQLQSIRSAVRAAQLDLARRNAAPALLPVNVTVRALKSLAAWYRKHAVVRLEAPARQESAPVPQPLDAPGQSPAVVPAPEPVYFGAGFGRVEKYSAAESRIYISRHTRSDEGDEYENEQYGLAGYEDEIRSELEKAGVAGRLTEDKLPYDVHPERHVGFFEYDNYLVVPERFAAVAAKCIVDLGRQLEPFNGGSRLPPGSVARTVEAWKERIAQAAPSRDGADEAIPGSAEQRKEFASRGFGAIDLQGGGYSRIMVSRRARPDEGEEQPHQQQGLAYHEAEICAELEKAGIDVEAAETMTSTGYDSRLECRIRYYDSHLIVPALYAGVVSQYVLALGQQLTENRQLPPGAAAGTMRYFLEDIAAVHRELQNAERLISKNPQLAAKVQFLKSSNKNEGVVFMAIAAKLAQAHPRADLQLLFDEFRAHVRTSFQYASEKIFRDRVVWEVASREDKKSIDRDYPPGEYRSGQAFPELGRISGLFGIAGAYVLRENSYEACPGHHSDKVRSQTSIRVPSAYAPLCHFYFNVGDDAMLKIINEPVPARAEIQGLRVLGRPQGAAIGNKEAGFLLFERLGLPYPPGIVLPGHAALLFTDPAVTAEQKAAYTAAVETGLAEIGLDPRRDEFSVRSNPKQSMPGILETVGPGHPMHGGDLFSRIAYVAGTWFSETAQQYRVRNGMPQDYNLPIIIQKWVSGRKPAGYAGGRLYASGVLSTRNPNTAARELYGTYLEDATGDELMTGGKNGAPLAQLKGAHPEIYARLAAAAEKLESEAGPQEIEFTVEDGKLFFLQTRGLHFSPAAEIAFITEQMQAGRISEARAIPRIEKLQSMLGKRRMYRVKPGATLTAVARGAAATTGALQGRIAWNQKTVEKLMRTGKPVVCFAREGNREYILGKIFDCPSAALITDYGNGSSHEAVLARMSGIPAIINVDGVRMDNDTIIFPDGTTVREGDVVTVDADNNLIAVSGKDVLEGNGEIQDISFGINIPEYRQQFLRAYLTLSGAIKPEYTRERLAQLNEAADEKYRQLTGAATGGDRKAAFIANLEKHFLHDLLRERENEAVDDGTASWLHEDMFRDGVLKSFAGWYRVHMAWWFETPVALAVAAGLTMLLPYREFTALAAMPVLAGLAFLLPHGFQGREVLLSNKVISITGGTMVAGLLLTPFFAPYLGISAFLGAVAASLAFFAILTIEHQRLNFGAEAGWHALRGRNTAWVADFTPASPRQRLVVSFNPATPDNARYDDPGIEPWTVEQHTAEMLKRFGGRVKIIGWMGNGNVMHNRGHVLFIDGHLYRRADDRDNARRSLFVVYKDGTMRVEDAEIKEERILIGGDDVTDRIEWATSGERTVRNGKPVKWRTDPSFEGYADPRHLFWFPIALSRRRGKEGDAFRAILWNDAEKKRRAAAGKFIDLPLATFADYGFSTDDGKPDIDFIRRELRWSGYSDQEFYFTGTALMIRLQQGFYQHHTIGMDAAGGIKTLAVVGKDDPAGTTFDELADEHRDAGIRDAIILDNGKDIAVFKDGQMQIAAEQARDRFTSMIFLIEEESRPPVAEIDAMLEAFWDRLQARMKDRTNPLTVDEVAEMIDLTALYDALFEWDQKKPQTDEDVKRIRTLVDHVRKVVDGVLDLPEVTPAEVLAAVLHDTGKVRQNAGHERVGDEMVTASGMLETMVARGMITAAESGEISLSIRHHLLLGMLFTGEGNFSLFKDLFSDVRFRRLVEDRPGDRAEARYRMLERIRRITVCDIKALRGNVSRRTAAEFENFCVMMKDADLSEDAEIGRISRLDAFQRFLRITLANDKNIDNPQVDYEACMRAALKSAFEDGPAAFESEEAFWDAFAAETFRETFPPLNVLAWCLERPDGDASFVASASRSRDIGAGSVMNANAFRLVGQLLRAGRVFPAHRVIRFEKTDGENLNRLSPPDMAAYLNPLNALLSRAAGLEQDGDRAYFIDADGRRLSGETRFEYRNGTDIVIVLSREPLAENNSAGITAARKQALARKLGKFDSALSRDFRDGSWSCAPLPGQSPEDFVRRLIDQAKENGHQAVELYLDDILGRHNRDSRSAIAARFGELNRHAGEIRRYAEKAGVRLIIHAWAITIIDGEGKAVHDPDPAADSDLFDRLLEFARGSGANMVTVHLGVPRKLDGYARLVEKAAASGITVGFENTFYNYAEETDSYKFYLDSDMISAEDFVAAVRGIQDRLSPEAQPFCAVTLDIPRSARQGTPRESRYTDPVECYRSVRDAGLKIADIHIAQTDRTEYRKRSLHAGGAVDMEAFFDLLEKDGYRGYINQEVDDEIVAPAGAVNPAKVLMNAAVAADPKAALLGQGAAAAIEMLRHEFAAVPGIVSVFAGKVYAIDAADYDETRVRAMLALTGGALKKIMVIAPQTASWQDTDPGESAATVLVPVRGCGNLPVRLWAEEKENGKALSVRWAYGGESDLSPEARRELETLAPLYSAEWLQGDPGARRRFGLPAKDFAVDVLETSNPDLGRLSVEMRGGLLSEKTKFVIALAGQAAAASPETADSAGANNFFDAVIDPAAGEQANLALVGRELKKQRNPRYRRVRSLSSVTVRDITEAEDVKRVDFYRSMGMDTLVVPGLPRALKGAARKHFARVAASLAAANLALGTDYAVNAEKEWENALRGIADRTVLGASVTRIDLRRYAFGAGQSPDVLAGRLLEAQAAAARVNPEAVIGVILPQGLEFSPATAQFLYEQCGIKDVAVAAPRDIVRIAGAISRGEAFRTSARATWLEIDLEKGGEMSAGEQDGFVDGMETVIASGLGIVGIQTGMLRRYREQLGDRGIPDIAGYIRELFHGRAARSPELQFEQGREAAYRRAKALSAMIDTATEQEIIAVLKEYHAAAPDSGEQVKSISRLLARLDPDNEIKPSHGDHVQFVARSAGFLFEALAVKARRLMDARRPFISDYDTRTFEDALVKAQLLSGRSSSEWKTPAEAVAALRVLPHYAAAVESPRMRSAAARIAAIERKLSAGESLGSHYDEIRMLINELAAIASAGLLPEPAALAELLRLQDAYADRDDAGLLDGFTAGTLDALPAAMEAIAGAA